MRFTLLQSFFYLLVFAGLTQSADLQANSWQRIALHDTDVLQVTIGTDNKLFATTRKGIFLSQDVGKTWKKELALNLNDYQFCLITLNTQGSVFAQVDDKIYERTGSPASWKQLTKQNWMVGLRRVFLTKEDQLIVTTGTELYRSSNHGTDWELIGDGLPSGYPDVWVLEQAPNGDLYAGTSGIVGGSVFRSTDLGSSFSMIFEGDVDNTIYGIFPTSNVLFISTSVGGVMKSTDQGAMWDYTDFDVTSGVRLFQIFERGSTLYALAKGSKAILSSDDDIYISPDQGVSWQKIEERLPETAGIRNIAFTPNGDIVAATKTGVYLYAAQANTYYEEEQAQPLSLMYANSSLLVSVPQAQNVSIQMCNALGNVVFEQPPTFFPKGTTVITLPNNVLHSGVYLCSAYCSEQTATIKLLVVQ